jgi:hypothetical protein
MSTLHASVLNAFKSKNWQYRSVTGMDVIESAFEAYHGKIQLHVQSFGEAHILSVVATSTLSVPPTHRNRAAELFMRTNKELNLGNFEFDWDSGAVMFRLSNVFPKHRYDEDVISSLAHNAVAEMDRITPFLGELIKTKKEMLVLLDVKELMAREELLPPEVEEVASA